MKNLSIGTRVLFLFMLCGLFFAISEAGVQLYLDYKTEIGRVEEQITQIQNNNLKSIAKSTWNLEADEVALQLEGALKLRDIEYLQVRTETGETLAASGIPPKENSISRSFPLAYHHHGKTNLIGSLHIAASLEGVSRRLFEKMIIIVFSRLLIVLLMSGVFLIIFQRLVSRHLSKMARYTQHLDLNSLGSPLILNRSASPKNSGDELEKVVRAINGMQMRIQAGITEIKQTKEILERNETRYRLMAENFVDVLWTLDMDLKFTYVSPSIYQQTGFTTEEALHLPLEKRLPKDALEQIIKLHQKNMGLIEAGDLRGWEPVTVKIEQYCKDGSKIWTQNIARFLPGPDNKPAKILGTSHDITDRVIAEQALKESEKKYRNLFESSMDAIMLLDLKRGYLDCNQAALKLFAISSKDELLNLTPADLSPKYQSDGTLSSKKEDLVIATAMETGSTLFEWTHKRMNGEHFFASVLVTRLEIEGRTILQGAVRDISEYKQTQEMMVQSEKMMSVGGLAAGMAHEINNPLAGMLQNANLLSNRLSDLNLPANLRVAKEVDISMEDMKDYMEKRNIPQVISAINESGRRMAAIVNNMLSFARKSDAQVSSHNLSDLLDKTLDLAGTDFDLKKHFDFKMIEIRKEYDKHLPQVPCESAKIQQVLLNIFRNGAQAMQEAETEHPRFTIGTSLDKTLQTARLTIEDNGPGMNKETMKRVFEPFFTTKPVGVGTGLGLSVSYFIITENHGGRMRVESTLGQGTKFIIHLPLEGKTAGRPPVSH